MAIKDGGPAFPQTNEQRYNDPIHGVVRPSDIFGEAHLGMKLRDYFAAKAMAALLSQMTYGNQGQHCAMYDPNDGEQAITLAHLSYQAADAMLDAREIERAPSSSQQFRFAVTLLADYVEALERPDQPRDHLLNIPPADLLAAVKTVRSEMVEWERAQ